MRTKCVNKDCPCGFWNDVFGDKCPLPRVLMRECKAFDDGKMIIIRIPKDRNKWDIRDTTLQKIMIRPLTDALETIKGNASFFEVIGITITEEDNT